MSNFALHYPAGIYIMFKTTYKAIKLPLNSLHFQLAKAIDEQQAKQEILAESAEKELSIKVKDWYSDAETIEAESKVALATCPKTKAYMEARAKAKAK